MNLKQYAIIKSQENILPADEIIAEVGGQAVPILWVGDEGRYCLLPKEIVQNLLDLCEQFQQTQGDFEYKIPTLQIVWSQGIEVDSDIGRILTGE